MGKYIKQLTNQDIELFLLQNNYVLCDTLKDRDGEPLPAITRDDDIIFLRCQRVLEEGEQEINKQLAYALYKKFRESIALSTLFRLNSYSTEIDMITMSDFDLNLIAEDVFIKPERGQKLFENYINFMIKKFDNQNYRDALITDYEKNSKTQEMCE